jgi:hypothetical protein
MSDPLSHLAPMGVMLELNIFVEVNLQIRHLLHNVELIIVGFLLYIVLLLLLLLFNMPSDYYLGRLLVFRLHRLAL